MVELKLKDRYLSQTKKLMFHKPDLILELQLAVLQKHYEAEYYSEY